MAERRKVANPLALAVLYPVPGDPATWRSKVLNEMARVTQPGGQVVVLSPRMTHHSALVLSERIPIRLLGRSTTIWSYRRPY